MITFEDFIRTPNGSIQLDWSLVESTVGFNIHEGLKNFYSRVICNEQYSIEGKYFLEETQFSKPIKDEYDSWLSLISGELYFDLHPLRTLEHYDRIIQLAFTRWTGGYNIGKRALIGSIYADVGDILLLFNNDSGAIEWNDPGYGHFEIYENNPYGIFADNIDQFYNKLSTKRNSI